MKKPNLLIAVPHNSGTTYLAALLANYFNQDVPYFHAADGYDGSDHVLSINKLNAIHNKNLSFVAPLHVRCSPYLEDAIQKYSMVPIIMTRNIFDCIVSLKDRIRKYKHKSQASSAIVFSHTMPEHARMNDYELEKFLIRYVVPWYFSYYASWKQSGLAKAEVSYENLIIDSSGMLESVVSNLGYEPDKQKIQASIIKTAASNTRLNKGIAGRGSELSLIYRSEITELSLLYPKIDFSAFF